MKLPRHVDGHRLAKALSVLGYRVTRQKGSHIRITTDHNGQHHEVIPAHKPIKPGTLAASLKSISRHHKISLRQLREALGWD